MITKAELLKKTKDELLKLAKGIQGLTVKATETKDSIVGKILDAGKKAAKKAPAAPKKAATAKKTAAPAAKAVKPVPAPAKSGAKNGTKAIVKSEAKKAPESPVAATRPATPSPAQYRPTAAKTRIVGITPNRVPQMPVRDEEIVEESKYYVAAAQEHLESANVPDSYQDNRIILFVRDPFWAFTSWDLHPSTPANTAQRHNINIDECAIALRVYDVTDIKFTGANAHRHFDVEAGAAKGSWYLNLPEDDRNYCVEVGLKTRRGDFYMMARSNVVRAPRNGVSHRIDEEWMIADEDFWKMYALSGGFNLRSGSSLEFTSEMHKYLAGETSSGFVSSFGSLRPKRQQDQFWFRLDCEVIVYGATEPDAKVTLMGHPVQLRPDGTFSARFQLPDGMQMFEATAVSANRKFEKTITPTVTRSTTAFQNRDLYEETEE